MTFGPEWEYACVGNLTAALAIFAPLTTTTQQSAPPLTAYEYPAQIFISSGYGTDGYSTTTFSNISTVTKGLIAADPFVIGWQQKDLSVFPTAYVSSLAQRWSISWDPPKATPASSSSLAKPTTSAPPENSLSTGEKAGISVGVVLGVALLAAILVFFLMNRRRNRKAKPNGRDVPEMEDQDATLAKKKWYLRGRWRSEIGTEVNPSELDSKTVNVVPGPPVEIDGTERARHEHDAGHGPSVRS
jgi:hypothetical protein